MLKQGTFICRKFNRLLLGNIWGWLGYCINLMTDSIISGNRLGETSLQAVTIVFPLFNLVTFFSILIAPGASVLFGKYIGEFKKDEAYRMAGTSIVAAFLIGGFLAFTLWLVKEPFLACYQCTDELYREASTYYNWLILYAVLNPFYYTFYYFAIIDGEALLLSLAEILNILFNVLFSIAFSQMFGIAGLGMATCLGLFAAVVSYGMHFTKKSNNVKFRLCFDVKKAGRSIVLGISKYMSYLFMAVVDIAMNRIIISSSGVELIPAYSVVNLVFGICEMFGALNDAGAGFITCFFGEKNNHDINIVLKKTHISMLFMSAGIMGFFIFGAPLMPVIYGLETPVTINAAITASRIMAFTVPGYGVCYLCSGISCSVEKPFQAAFICFLLDFASPLLLSLLFGSLWGLTGITIGMCLSTFFAFGLYSLFQILRQGKAGFPIYVKNFGGECVSYDLRVEPASIIKLCDVVTHEFTSRGFEKNNIRLLLEEFFQRVIEKNPGRAVLSGCTVIFDADRVRIIIRDDGTLFNFVDENNKVESLNAYVLSSLLGEIGKKKYLITTSFNRNEFVFEK